MRIPEMPQPDPMLLPILRVFLQKRISKYRKPLPSSLHSPFSEVVCNFPKDRVPFGSYGLPFSQEDLLSVSAPAPFEDYPHSLPNVPKAFHLPVALSTISVSQILFPELLPAKPLHEQPDVPRRTAN